MVNPYSAPSGTVAYPGTYSATPSGEVSQGAIEALRQTRPWVFFLAVLGFIGSGLMVLGGLSLAAVGAFMASSSTEFPPWLGLIYVVLAPIYVAPSVKLVKYAGAIRRLMASGSSAELERALIEQKGFWKLVGIMVITLLVVYVIAVAGFAFFAVMKAMH